ncbi:MAG: radical SAM protein [Mariprofundaceae bacterium]
MQTGTQDFRCSGDFAQPLQSLQNGSLTHAQQKRLALLEKLHPALAGLSLATPTPLDASRFLLPDGLGMLFIELTQQCNERCIHCYADSAPEMTQALTLQEVKGVLKQAFQLGNPVVQFTGGDPLIHGDLVEFVAYAYELGYPRIEIYTNGLLLHKKILAELAPYNPDFAFSIYSQHAETHDAITRLAGSHARTLDAAERVQALGLAVRFGVVIMPENKDDIDKTRHFLMQKFHIETSRVSFDAVRQTGRGTSQELLANLLPGGAAGHVTPEDSGSMITRGKLCVAASGDLFPCIFSRKTRLGSIRHNTLTEIMAALSQRQLPQPNPSNWKSCVEELSCQDCRVIAWMLADPTREEIPIVAG